MVVIREEKLLAKAQREADHGLRGKRRLLNVTKFKSGELHGGFNDSFPSADVHESTLAAWKSLDQRLNIDVNNGTIAGFSVWSQTPDPLKKKKTEDGMLLPHFCGQCLAGTI